jgi:hypothetical protein
MKKIVILFILCLTLIMSPQIVSSQATCAEPWLSCQIEPSPIPNYVCHDYVRAALEKQWVDLNTGSPTTSSSQFSSIGGGAIATDSKYVFVPVTFAYDVVTYHTQWTDHSVLKLRNSNLFAAKWNTLPLYWLKDPSYYQGSYLTDPKYLVYVGNPSPLSASLVTDQQLTFSINRVNGLSYLWTYDPFYFSLVGGNVSSETITLAAKCPGGNTNVTVKIWYPGLTERLFTIPVAISQDCECKGTYQINGSGTAYPLYTVNSVSGSPIITTLYGGANVVYTWTKTSGSPISWYSYGTGNKNLYVALNKNTSASFRFTSSNCNRSITFYRGSSLMVSKSLSTHYDSVNAELDTLFIPYDADNESAKSVTTDANVHNGVYVNQTRKALIINDNIEGEREYKIVSIQGILKKNGKVYGPKAEIDIQDLPSGIYIITILDCSYRFVKQ